MRDLGSTNGTPIATPTPIRDGDCIELADTHLQFQMSAPTVIFTAAPSVSAL